MFRWIKQLFSPPKPAGPPRIIKQFNGSESILSKDVVVTDQGNWLIDSDKTQTFRLFEVEITDLDNCMLKYRADLKSEDIQERCYLEMWCRIPNRGEFFSKGFQTALQGNNDWATYETPFYLKSGQKPDLVKLNIIIEGSGKVWIRNVELSFIPFE
jgi:hypothetical protein